MNIYVLLAIALSAFTGVADVSAARRGSAEVVSARCVRPEAREVRSEKRVIRTVSKRSSAHSIGLSAAPSAAPLSGAATPRAPAA